MNNKLMVVGAVIAILAVVGFMVFSSVISPAPIKVLVSQVDLAAGQPLANYPLETSFIEVTADSDHQVSGLLVTPEEYAEMAAAGGLFARDFRASEPLVKTGIVSPNNEAAVLDPMLANTDPNLVVIHIDAKDIVPDSVRIGDRIDVSVSLTGVDVTNALTDTLATDVLKAEAVEEAQAEDPGLVVDAEGNVPEEYPLEFNIPSTSDTVPYEINPPLSKVVVYNARVVGVTRDEKAQYGGFSGDETTASEGTQVQAVTGAITALDILVPRSAFELLSLSSNAGVLNLAVVSPLAGDDTPTSLGISINDLLLAFYADRGLIAEKGKLQPTIDIP